MERPSVSSTSSEFLWTPFSRSPSPTPRAISREPLQSLSAQQQTQTVPSRSSSETVTEEFRTACPPCAATIRSERTEHSDAVDTGDNRRSQPRALATRRAAYDGGAFRTGEDPGLYARFRWEYARHDPHKPHRRTALWAGRFAHKESSVPLHRHSSNKSSLDGDKIIHTRSCNLGVSSNTTSPGQSRGRAGASLLTADRLPRRVDLLTRLITCHWATRHDRTITILILCNIDHVS
jgi:hypothetical protein